MSTGTYALSVTLDEPFEQVLDEVKQALATQGFGVVTEIDMAATLRNKIGVEIEPQVILGACNPRFASRALEIEPSIGLLLPCNVVVRHTAGVTMVEAINPRTLVTMTENARLEEVANQVSEALGAALEVLRGAEAPASVAP